MAARVTRRTVELLRALILDEDKRVPADAIDLAAVPVRRLAEMA
jgi:hypothetical protein